MAAGAFRFLAVCARRTGQLCIGSTMLSALHGITKVLLHALILLNIPIFMKASYSTAEVAHAIGVSKITLLRWLWTGKLKEPKREIFGGVESRVWSSSDLEVAKAHREQNFRKRKRS